LEAFEKVINKVANYGILIILFLDKDFLRNTILGTKSCVHIKQGWNIFGFFSKINGERNPNHLKFWTKF
jgi:hypothetical protein